MGYHISFHGEVAVRPPLLAEDRSVLEYIFNSEQKKRDVFFQIPALPEKLAAILRQDSYIGSEFRISADGTSIEALGEESSYDGNSMEQFWQQIVQHVLPNYSVTGQFDWDATASNDGTGVLWICGNQVESVTDVPSNPGPRWEREGKQ
jgi:hypothetical protein